MSKLVPNYCRKYLGHHKIKKKKIIYKIFNKCKYINLKKKKKKWLFEKLI